MQPNDTSASNEGENRERELIRRARRNVDHARQPSPASHGATGQRSRWADGASVAALPPADSFPGYEIIHEIHRGGQGVVYQAIQQSTHRKVAIKVMKEGPFASPADHARFEREIEILGQLRHRNIVTIHDTGKAAAGFYFVMEYVNGKPLNDHMNSKDYTIKETLTLFAKICEAVNAAHLRGVVHRDLKPGNIRIDTEGEPRVLDFGLAKVATGEAAAGQAMTMTGEFVGSLPWASPEQAEGIPAMIDIRTDVYSLGVILFQMLTGRFPYEIVGSMRVVLNRIMTAEPIKPSTFRKQINDEVETMVLKCLARERERRYQSAGELARDVRHYLAGEPIEAKRDSAWYVLRKSILRYKTVIALTTASVAVAMLIAAIVLLFQHNRADKAETERATAVIQQYTKASNLQKLKQWYPALLEFQEVLRLDPINARALGNLAIVEKEYYYSQQPWNLMLIYDALEKCTEALEIEPADARRSSLFNLKGVLLRILDEHQDALRAFEKAAELDPEPKYAVAVFNNWGETYAILGNLTAAREKLERAAALAQDCKSPPCYAWRDLATFQLFRNNSQAAQAIEQAIKCGNPESPDQAAHRTRAMIRLLWPSYVDVEGALDDAKHADRIADEADPRTKRVRAMAHLRNEEFRYAAAHASLAIQNGDLATPNRLIIAIAKAHLGELPEAQASYDLALDEWPEDLKQPGQYQARVDEAILWFDTAEDLLQLQEQAAGLLQGGASDP